MDPPWPESGAGKSKRGADRHYKLMKKHDIIRTIYQSGYWNPAPRAHLWIWSTNNYLEDALFVMEALGFQYKTNAVWTKPKYGLGRYLRGKHELCLLGTKGPYLAQLIRNESTWFGDDALGLGEHSEKPDASYEKIEAVSPGPRLEMFARKRRDGWWVWGNGVGVDVWRRKNVDAML